MPNITKLYSNSRNFQFIRLIECLYSISYFVQHDIMAKFHVKQVVIRSNIAKKKCEPSER